MFSFDTLKLTNTPTPLFPSSGTLWRRHRHSGRVGHARGEREAILRVAEGGGAGHDQRGLPEHELQPADDFGQHALCRLHRWEKRFLSGNAHCNLLHACLYFYLYVIFLKEFLDFYFLFMAGFVCLVPAGKISLCRFSS